MKQIILCAIFAMGFMPCVAQNDTLVVNKADKVTVITGDSVQKVIISGKENDPEYRYENVFRLADSGLERNVSVNGEQLNLTFPIPKKGGKETSENDISARFGIGWCNAINSPADMDVSMGSSWEIFFTIPMWDYTPNNGRSTFSAGLGFDWRNWRMSDDKRFVKDDGNVVITDYPFGANPKFSRIKVFSLQVPLNYTFNIGKGFSVGGGPVLNFNTYSSIKTRYYVDGEKVKDVDKNARVNPITVDIMGYVMTPALNFYVKYSPCNLLKSDHGPKFQTISVGLFI